MSLCPGRQRLAAAQPRQILFRRHQRQRVALWLPRSGASISLSKTDDDRQRRAAATTSMPLARSVLKNRAGSPMPAKASTRLPRKRRDRGLVRPEMRRSTGLPCAAMAAATASAAAAIADDDQRIGARELRPQRRAQGTCGKHAGHCRGRGRRRSRSARHPWRSPDSGSRHPSGSRWRPATAPAATPSARSRATTTGNVARQHQRLVADIGSRVPRRDRP